MKLFWKLLIGMESILLLVLAIMGCFLMYFSSRNIVEREREKCIEEAQLFEYALQTSILALPEGYAVGELAVAQIAESVQNTMMGERVSIAIYPEYGAEIFAHGETNPSIRELEISDSDYGIRVVHRESGYFMETLSVMKIEEVAYQLELDRDITYIYEDREELLRNYRIAMLLSVLVSILVTTIVTAGLTRPITKLARETMVFAEGNYSRRVKVRGNDEVSDLMRAYNRMADALEANMEQLREDARRKDDFISAFAHELKTPLTSIIGYSDMIRSREMTQEDRMLAANYIFCQGRRLEQLSYKLMELVGMKESQITLAELSVRELCRQAAEMTLPLLADKQMTLEMEVQEAKILGDRDLLLSLITNLMDNARKACGEKGSILVTGVVRESTYELSLTDNGCGIPEAEIPKITEAFYMVDKSRSRKEGGAGIGMALCQKIVQLHGATWEIQSKLGEGTRIRISFPTAKSGRKCGDDYEKKKE